MAFHEIKVNDLNENVFNLIGKDWFLISAEKEGTVNTMTVAWATVGILWQKNVVMVAVRPERYTKEFLDASDTFSLTVFDKSYKKMLGYCGTVSGRDEDKIAKSNLTINHIDGTPYFEEADMVIVCKKLYAQEMKPECFIIKELDSENYPKKDYHTLYISEIEKIYRKG